MPKKITYLGTVIYPKPKRKANQHYKESILSYWLRRFKAFVRRVLIVSIAAGALLAIVSGGVWYGRASAASEMIVTNSIIKPSTNLKASLPPVMKRIADCESGVRLPSGKAVEGTASQFDKYGQVLTRGNTDKTTDTGHFQINSVHNREVSQMGLDLTKEADNIAYAMHLYENEGTGPWYSSRSCWQ